MINGILGLAESIQDNIKIGIRQNYNSLGTYAYLY